ncbi:MAG: HRDC domain-containing protein [Pirellulales bacterium]
MAELGHERLSTFGLLKENTQAEVRFWLDQLVAQQYLQRSGEYQTLTLTQTGRLVLRGAETPKLGLPPTKRKAAKSSTAREQVSWEGVDRELFEVLRQTRMELAAQRQVPAYVIFGDAVLREMARVRPSSTEAFARIRGVGRQKLADFAEIFLETIDTYCSSRDVVRDVISTESLIESESDDTDLGVLKLSGGAAQCLPMFEAGEPFEAIAAKVNRARSTVMGYFAEFMEYAGVTDVSAWVSPEDEEAVLAAADETWTDGRLRTLYERLGEKIPYDIIRIVLTCRKNRSL